MAHPLAIVTLTRETLNASQDLSTELLHRSERPSDQICLESETSQCFGRFQTWRPSWSAIRGLYPFTVTFLERQRMVDYHAATGEDSRGKQECPNHAAQVARRVALIQLAILDIPISSRIS